MTIPDDVAVFLEADRMRSLAINQANFENQRAVALPRQGIGRGRNHGLDPFCQRELNAS